MTAERPTVDYDEVEEALTDMWMANTLCLTFLTLNSIAFACAVWGVPVILEAIRAQGQEPHGWSGAVLGIGSAANASSWLTGALWVGLSGGAVAAQVFWSNRRGRIWLFFLASCVPLALTIAICATALLA